MDVIMDSVAETRDRLNRLVDRSDGEAGTNPRATSRRCQHGKLSRSCELCDRERKIESLDRLCRRQSSILTGVAKAVGGEPEETYAWSHHDLVERVQAVMAEVEALRGEREAQTKVQAQLLADLQIARQSNAPRKRPTRPKASAYLFSSQSQLLELAAQLGIVKARDRSAGNTRSDQSPLQSERDPYRP